MKAKIIAIVVVLVAIGLIVANQFLGKAASRELDNVIQTQIKGSELEGLLTYDDIKVNARKNGAFATNFKLGGEREEVELTCKKIRLNVPYAYLLKIVKGEEIEFVKKFSGYLDDVVFKNNDDDITVALDNFSIDFDGEIPVEFFESDRIPFPEEIQTLEISAKGISWDAPEVFEDLDMPPDYIKQMSTTDNIRFKLEFDSKAKELRCVALEAVSSMSKGNFRGTLKFKGDTPREFMPTGFSCGLKSEMTDKFEWAMPDGAAKFSIEDANVDMEMEADLFVSRHEEFKLKKLNGTFCIKNFKFELGDMGKQLLSQSLPSELGGLDLDEFVIDKFAVGCNFDGKQLKIHHTELVTTYLTAVLDADITVDEDDFEDSHINSGKLTIKNISDDLAGTISFMQTILGMELPRDKKGNLVFKFSGTFDDPKIEGLDI